jgi:Xaa-Pro aminopeptidase
MFQSFDERPDPSVGPVRVARLRTAMKTAKLQAYLVPRADEHKGEYVPPSAERLKWLTGFSGSAGWTIILLDAAALFVDGRYTVQSRSQVDTATFEIREIPAARSSDYLIEHLKKGDKAGYDPRLHPLAEIEQLTEKLEPKGIKLVATSDNLVDRIWTDRPAPPLALVAPHAIEYAGQSASGKIAALQKTLTDAKEDAVVLSMTDSVAWTFNIRGGDVAHTPVTLAFAIVPAKGKPELFIEPAKLGDNVRGILEEIAKLRKPEALEKALTALGAKQARVRLDPNSSSMWIADTLKSAGAKIARASDPTVLPRAIKNATEIKGSRTAHERDGVAVCRFLSWLDREASQIENGASRVDEINAARQLEAFRQETGLLKEISFDTISGAGSNGAIVHYRPLQSTNRKLGAGELYLVDSGAQYLDGTTDITRTIAIGSPSEEMRQRVTLVLKGHIAIATARFPKGTRGVDIDGMARRSLWLAGLDFDHGTGHGVGSYLSVHEGPQSISKNGMQAFEPGMIVSNEPGFYKEGAYGIRLETLLLVTPPAKIPGGTREMLGFETLTLAPFDRRLIVAGMLEAGERAWLDAYHVRVLKVIGPKLKGDDKRWLEAATKPLA